MQQDCISARRKELHVVGLHFCKGAAVACSCSLVLQRLQGRKRLHAAGLHFCKGKAIARHGLAFLQECSGCVQRVCISGCMRGGSGWMQLLSSFAKGARRKAVACSGGFILQGERSCMR